MRLLFARHGESQANVQQVISNRDLPHKLTQLGILQSIVLGKFLEKWHVEKIISSPIPRARETAKILSQMLGPAPDVAEALREFDCGMMEGRQDEEAWDAHRSVIRAWDDERDYDRRILPDGESFNDVKRRFVPFIKSLVKKNESIPGEILLITHGGILYQMLPLVLSNIDRGFTRQHTLGHCQLIVTALRDRHLVCSTWAGIELS